MRPELLLAESPLRPHLREAVRPADGARARREPGPGRSAVIALVDALLEEGLEHCVSVTADGPIRELIRLAFPELLCPP